MLREVFRGLFDVADAEFVAKFGIEPFGARDLLQAIDRLGPLSGLLVFQPNFAIDAIGQFRVDVPEEIQQGLVARLSRLKGPRRQGDELLGGLLVHRRAVWFEDFRQAPGALGLAFAGERGQ